MCESSDGHPPGPVPPTSVTSRRAFLAMGAAAGGLLATIWAARQIMPQLELPKPMSATPVPQPVPTLVQIPKVELPPSSAPAPVPTTTPAATAAAPGVIKDIGSELFPDPAGRAMAGAADAPVIIIPRSDWTQAKPNLSQMQLMNGIELMTVHHTAGETSTDAWLQTANSLEGIRGFHAGTTAADRQWADIAYHFAIDRAGRVWQARPLAYQGAHVKGHNEHNLGIVLLGNFEIQSPAAAQLWTLGEFITFLRGLYHIPLDHVFTHGELGQSTCPGKTLQAFMNRSRKAWSAA